jgi:hypothetical protein
MTSYPNRIAMLELAEIWMRLAEHAEGNKRLKEQLQETWQGYKGGRQLMRP